MQKIFSALAAIALTIWVGGLLITGYLAVPVLFHTLADKQLAGLLAGEIFHAMGAVGMVCGGILLLRELTSGVNFLRNKNAWLITAMLLLGLVIQFAIAPVMADLKIQAQPLDVMHSTFADRFKMLHGMSSILYLMESLLGVWLVMRAYAFSRF